jgi:hypothetical protein
LLIFLFVVDTYHSLTTKEEFENTKGVIRIRKSKKNRQHNGNKRKDNRANTIFKTYIKTKHM